MSINYDRNFTMIYKEGQTRAKSGVFSCTKYFHWVSFLSQKTKRIIIIFRMTNNKSCFIFIVRVLWMIFSLRTTTKTRHSCHKHFRNKKKQIYTHKKDNFSIFVKQSQCQMWDQVLLLLLHQQLTQTLMMLMALPLPLNNIHILRWQHRFQARPTIMVFMLMKLTVQLPNQLPSPKHSFGNVNYVLLGKKRDIFVFYTNTSLQMNTSIYFESQT